ncbi:MAG TPA: hypothetical protein EYO33_02150 [Phycisphaerales bacterium]|nr:hypothetical protein [Phycisphaerales bacterium]
MLHFVTVASGPHPGLQRLETSAKHYGIDLVVLGYNKPYPGNGAKVTLVAEFASQVDPEDFIVYTDAFDSVFAAPPQAFKEALREFSSDLIFSAEQNFHMLGHPVFYLWQNVPTYLGYPESPSRYRFLNAGSFVGRARRLARLPEKVHIDNSTPSDQTIFTRYFVSFPEAVSLDYQHKLMTCNGGRVGYEAKDYCWEGDRLKNRVTETYPCLVHVPGKNEGSFHRLLETSPFPAQRQLKEKDRRTYHRRSLLHRLIVNTTGDNFRFKFLIWNLTLLGLLMLVVVSSNALAEPQMSTSLLDSIVRGLVR